MNERYNVTLSQSHLMALLTILAEKPAEKPVTYAQISALVKQGMPNTYTASWLTKPTRQFNVDDVLAFFAGPRERKVPSRHGVRMVEVPGVVLDEAKVKAALAQVLAPKPKKEKETVEEEEAQVPTPDADVEPDEPSAAQLQNFPPMEAPVFAQAEVVEEEEPSRVFRFNEELYANDSND